MTRLEGGTPPLADTAPRPNLFVVGAMKSGTTWLHRLLDSHPSIFMSDPKEPSFFVDTELLERVVCRTTDDYLRLFETAAGMPVIGESSTNYSKLPAFPGAAERIHRFNPRARIVYLMRDPVERTISHYWHAVRLHTETRDMLAALTHEGHYRDVSHYARQLGPYLDRFGDGVLAITAESLWACPRRVLRRIFRFLGVDAAFDVPGLEQRINATENIVLQARGAGLLRRLRRSAGWERFSAAVPRGMRALGRRLSEREVDRRGAAIDAVIELLRPTQRAQTDQLGELLDRRFPEWSTLWGTDAAGQ